MDWTAVPTTRSGFRPILSTNPMAKNVNKRLIKPIQTEDTKAAFLPAPAVLNISVE